MSETWYTRCVRCGDDIPKGRTLEHNREKHPELTPHVPFSGKVNEPIVFAPHETPKV